MRLPSRWGTAIKVNKNVSFRPPTRDFCARFNAVLRAGKLNMNDLCVLAIDAGLEKAMETIIERDEADARKRKKAIEFLKRKAKK